MAFKAKYLGEPECAIRAFGAVFEDDVADLDDRFRAKVEGNPFFEIVGKSRKDDPDDHKGDPVDIPSGWEDLHWAQQEKLALEIVGGTGPLVPSEGQTRADKAKAIISAELADRAK